jgi:LuxR family maltose regulon positive regulatory protein
MSDKFTSIPLIHTKFHRASLPRDYLHRPRLADLLSQGVDRALTLVSAPAGYGKSTLLGSWLDHCGALNLWLSLDDNDNDLNTFLTYFVSAIRTVFPKALAESRALLASANMPESSIVTGTLVRELAQIEEPFVFVLDDYHLINDALIHQLITAIVVIPRSPMHMAMATRQDPPMPLASFRAKGQMTEIRVNDLRFTPSETAAFVEKSIGYTVTEKAAAALEAKAEGWVTAIRLAALTIDTDPEVDRMISNLPEENQYVAEYFLSEVVSRQPPEIQEYLLRTAVVDRFCIALCNALCIPGVDPDTCDIGGLEFIRWLMETNLFVIPLDAHNRWFRYHHLLQQLLHRQLERQLDEEKIRQIHRRAGDWFESQGLLEEALHHRLETGDMTGAARIVTESRHDLMNREQWHRLNRWTEKLPQEVVDNNIELLLTKGWLYENRLRLAELMQVVDRIETMLKKGAATGGVHQHIKGEYNALKAAASYLQGDGPGAVDHARQSIDQIPEKHSSALAFALIVLSFGLQMTGEGAQGRQIIFDALSSAERHVRTYHARLLFGLCFLDWLEADMHGVRQTAEQVIMFGKKHGLLESLSFGHYFMGLALYHLDDLTGAESHLETAIEKGYLTNINTFAHASYLLALIRQAQAHPEAAKTTAEAVTAYALSRHNTVLLQESKAFQAELALRQHHLAPAVHWAKTYDPKLLTPVLRFYMAPLTLLKAQLAQKSPDMLKQAFQLSSHLVDYYTGSHNHRALVEILIQKALLYKNLRQPQKAQAALKQALKMSRHGGNRRPFIDVGSPMADLLVQITADDGPDPFIDRIIDAIGRKPDQADAPAPPKSPLLSVREMDVLQLLAQNERDKEIAQKLFISPATVKRHCANIYAKLKVNGRGKAVEKARELGLL